MLKIKDMTDEQIINVLNEVVAESDDWCSRWCDDEYITIYLENEKDIICKNREDYKRVIEIAKNMLEYYEIEEYLVFTFGASYESIIRDMIEQGMLDEDYIEDEDY